jgi:hypothetical protein
MSFQIEAQAEGNNEDRLLSNAMTEAKRKAAVIFNYVTGVGDEPKVKVKPAKDQVIGDEE